VGPLVDIDEVQVASRSSGVIAARLRLARVTDVSYLRRANGDWTAFSAGNGQDLPLFNWVSVFNFNAAEDVVVLTLHTGSVDGNGSDGNAQALMHMKMGHVVRCDRGHRRPLVYVGFLEVAPWNKPDFSRRRFAGLGPVMLRYAHDVSLHMGYEGRVGLHSIVAAEAFYRNAGFRGHDCPSEHHELYMELDGASAQRLIGQ
jgi:hypothetical protein